MSRVPREVWWIIGLTALALGLAALLGGAEQSPSSRPTLPNHTTYSSSPTGLRGLYLALQRLGYRTGRLRRPLTGANLPSEGTLFVVDPFRPPVLSSREEKDLYRWVAAGHRLVLCNYPPGMMETESEAPPETDLEWVFLGPEWSEARPAQPTYLLEGAERLAIRSSYRIPPPDKIPEEAEEKSDDTSFPTGLAPGDDKLEKALRRAAPVAGDDYGVVASYARVGKGDIVLLSSAWSLSNEGIAKGDNFEFALHAIGPPKAGPVYFDEYHHGYTESAAWALTPRPVKAAIGLLVMGLLLVALARSRRLGPVVPLSRGGRPRSEFLGTMTTVLRRGGATRLAVQTAVDTSLERLRVELGLERDANDEAIVAALRRTNPRAAERLSQALSDLRRELAGRRLTEPRALDLLRRWDEAVAAARQIQL